ncbi:MAG TPA: hypothetical protein PLC74_00980 [Acetobacteraceae bacterium]|nr:hypothetical protein [Acetobacteraceae bacterium]
MIVPKPPKAVHERQYFGCFRQYSHLPDGQIEYRDKPDVILSGKRKIGIEITHLYRQSGSINESEQRQRPLRERIVELAYTHHIDNGVVPFGLTASFNPEHPIDPRNVEELGQYLADIAKLPNERFSPYIDLRSVGHRMPEISTIQRSTSGLLDTKWQIAQVFSVLPTDENTVREIVETKERRVSDYEPCEAYWLVIIVEGMDPGQEQEIRIDRLTIETSLFEKVILFHTFGYVVEANIAASDA